METKIRPAPGLELSAAEYEQLILSEPDEIWELVRGRLREKPTMAVQHGRAAVRLVGQLDVQLDPNDHLVSTNHARLKRVDRSYIVPDVVVIRMANIVGDLTSPGTVDAHAAPALLVVEVWSPSTGDYDIEEKLRGYQERGDLEIWRLHPYRRELTVWRRQPDQSYIKEVLHGGTIKLHALPDVVIILDRLFI
jgi:Uma2 family endonuclease